MEHPRPKRREDLSVKTVDDETIVMDGGNEQIHQLNTTASFIWSLLDGEHGIDEIAGAMAQTFDADEETIRGDIASTIEEFDKLGLLS